MSQPTILIVDSDTGKARKLREAISERLLTNIVHWCDGESAVIWLGANDCDLCILSYELPGIDGLETLARLRSRRPDLPSIMIADTKSQDVAVAAFRAGVIDFVSTSGNFVVTVAQITQRVLTNARDGASRADAPIVDPRLEKLPPARKAPTYQNRLRVIGRQMDLYEYQSVSVIEVDGGFLARAVPRNARKPEALEFPDRDFPLLILSSLEDQHQERRISKSDLIPTGYEDFLRALGYLLDTMLAESVVITELRDVVAVGGRGINQKRLAATLEPFQMFLRASDIEYMLNEAFMRRGKPDERRQAPKSTVDTGLRGILKRLN